MHRGCKSDAARPPRYSFIVVVGVVVVVVAVVGGGGGEVPLPSKTAIFLFQK